MRESQLAGWCPHALHIADRFHLPMNAMTCPETVLTREQATLLQVATTLCAEHRKAHPDRALRFTGRWMFSSEASSDEDVSNVLIQFSDSLRMKVVCSHSLMRIVFIPGLKTFKHAGQRQNLSILPASSNDLHPNRKSLRSKTSRNAHCWMPCLIERMG
jgi:hypothetical protein